MTTGALVGLLVTVGIVTFLYRYAMIGFFAGRRLPGGACRAGCTLCVGTLRRRALRR